MACLHWVPETGAAASMRHRVVQVGMEPESPEGWQHALCVTVPPLQAQSHSFTCRNLCALYKAHTCNHDKNYQFISCMGKWAALLHFFDSQNIPFTELLSSYPFPHLENLSKI